MEQLELAADAVGPVRRGHPWVYRDGVRIAGDLTVGDPVELCDGAGRVVAFGLADTGPIAVRVLARRAESVPRLILRRIEAARALRDRVIPDDTDAYRLVNGAGDWLPEVVVDRYGPLAVVRLYSAAWVPYLHDIVGALQQLALVESIARRGGVKRVDDADGLELLAGPAVPETLVVREAGLSFIVRPVRGQKTGLFLDQRENRRWVAGISRDRTVINLFGYNGGFSVHAAAGGAAGTITVDTAREALADARDNFRLNGFDLAAHGFECADAFAWKPERSADIVVCDPPSLSHASGSDGAARRSYRDLAAHAGSMVSAGGVLVACSCTARVGEDRWMDGVRKGLATTGGRWSVIHRAAEPPDHPVALGHPEGRYLKLAALHRL